jgi:predicted transcriptional regulator
VAQNIDINTVTVGDVMSEGLLVLNKHQELQEALDMMCAKGVRRAPVSDDQHTLVGIAATDDIFLLIAEEIASLSKIMRKQIAV